MATIVDEKETQEEKIEVQTKSIKLTDYLKEVRTEFLKITWPSREQVTRELISVILLVAVLTTAIFAIDKVFEVVSNFFTGRL